MLDGNVTRVIDGDTLVARTAYGESTVRLLGIDTPETKKPGTAVECGGPQAARVMRRVARPGESITLRTDSTQDTVDRYGRLLAYVTGSDGRLLQVDVLQAGWAKVYVFETRFKRYARFAAVQRSARRAKRGLFRRCGGRVHRRARASHPGARIASVRDCNNRAWETSHISSVRNMRCRGAATVLRRYRGVVRRVFRVSGFRCRRVSGVPQGGQWRCARARKAFRFEFGD